MCAAEERGLPLEVWWPSEPRICSASFKGLFDSKNLPKWLSVKEDWPLVSSEILLKTQDDWERVLRGSFSGYGDGSLPYLKSYYHFYTRDHQRWLRHLRSLEPRQEFVEKVRELLGGRDGGGGPVVGIHIRRGDHRHCIETSPTDLFIQKMRERVAAEPATVFFVASDDEREKRGLREALGTEKILVGAEVLNRHTAKGGADAFLDFLALSQCQEIWGSAGSSFSEVAAQYGAVPYVAIGGTGAS